MKFFILGLVMCVGAAGGVEHLPPTASVGEWAAVLGAAVVGLCFALVGVLDMHDKE